jgi:molybdopterin-biosynthesis enzyme MoeA-like protein
MDIAKNQFSEEREVIRLKLLHMERLLIEYSNIPERRREIEIKLRETQQFKQNAVNTLKVPNFDGMPHGTEMRDIVYQAVQKIIDEYQVHLDYYCAQIKLYNQAETDMYDALKCLDKNEYNIIYHRYIKGYEWLTVALKTNNSERNCYNIRDIALEKLAQNYKE